MGSQVVGTRQHLRGEIVPAFVQLRQRRLEQPQACVRVLAHRVGSPLELRPGYRLGANTCDSRFRRELHVELAGPPAEHLSCRQIW